MFRAHYQHKRDSTNYVFWKTVVGCDLYLGYGHLPPIVGCQLYYALLDCHLTHGSNMILDVDPISFHLLDGVNHLVLRRILGLGHHSGIPQLYSELGIYPLLALTDAESLRACGFASWLGDMAYVLRNLPFDMPPLPTLGQMSSVWCDNFIKLLRRQCRAYVHDWVNAQPSLSLLHGRLEPFKEEPSRVVHLTRQHYLHRVTVANHRLALTRLLCGSFHLRGIHRPHSDIPLDDRLCRKCGLEVETPEHVLLLCRDAETAQARQELQDRLRLDFHYDLELPKSHAEAHVTLQQLIFHWHHVVPAARFIHKVSKCWHWFGHVLPTELMEDEPAFEGEHLDDSDTEADGW
ncbi:hypothetical protein GGX14DRAFT_587410 [Mycena pura]|uniref:Uncharacterized protein n=1 Tax=Mycena pura TaxID=153505 RepID=A0AAD6USZ5_9AGAR|nr:hypothetical protein GGX14DRAFT_587410 [Mycena pura]